MEAAVVYSGFISSTRPPSNAPLIVAVQVQPSEVAALNKQHPHF